MRAETAEERSRAAEWAAVDLKSGMGWEVEGEVEKAPGPVTLAALPTMISPPEGEQRGVPGWEGKGEPSPMKLGKGRPGEDAVGGTAGDEGGGGAPEGGSKVERM